MSEHYNIAVIGSGPGGYIAALKSAQMGAKTAIVEKHLLGGTCLNYGCIPSKTLLASSELIHKIDNASDFGVSVDNFNFDWISLQKRKDGVLKKLRGGISGLFASRKVQLYNGNARFSGPGQILIEGENGQSQAITTDKLIIATGSVPSRIPGWPDDPNFVCTSDEALHWDKLPDRLLIVGGGVIGCEFACMMNEFGVKITIVEMMDQLLPEMEEELGSALADVFSKRDIDINCGVKVEDLSINSGSVKAIISGGKNIEVDKVLVSTGRMPNTLELGLDKIGLDTDRGFISVNNKMETDVKDCYCIGDANGRCLLAHAASAQGVVAVKNALDKETEQNLPVPNAVYTFPEIASVGMTTKQAYKEKVPVKIGRFPIGYLGKAMAVGEEFGFVKVLRHREDDTLLGVHIIGHNATEIIESATALLSVRAKGKDIADMIFAHPTIGEAVKEAAEDSFDQAMHLPPRKISKIIAISEEVKYKKE